MLTIFCHGESKGALKYLFFAIWFSIREMHYAKHAVKIAVGEKLWHVQKIISPAQKHSAVSP
ncbi:hypothetical protein ACSX1A_10845 [Pontibacter sp. MBLB2868]|uniref:hypothetical protein n=1 Tax=Pontibacter sp. MBLB2868 TaxID=3451555 RepID=UPI003F75547F